MDTNPTQEHMKFIGFFGIFSQSFKTIFNFKTLFTQITITSILPLAITIIAHMSISDRFFNQIEQNPYQLFFDAYVSYRSYYGNHAASSDWLYYLIFKFTTVAAVTAFAVVSTTTVVYTVASVYTGREITFRESLKSVPKTGKKLTVTLLCFYITLIAFNLIVSVVIFFSGAVAGETGFYVFAILAISGLHFFGFLFLISVTHLAGVISVLENSYGIKAIVKSIDLINGKKKLVIRISFVLYVFLIGVVCVYMTLVMYGGGGGGLRTVWRVMIGILTGVLLVIGFLVMIVVETVVYIVCKSYHGETIAPVSLSTYLGAYLSDSRRQAFRVGEEDIQLGRPQNQPV